MIPIAQQATYGEGEAKTLSPDAEGRMRLRDPGLGIGEDGDPSFSIPASGAPMVAHTFKAEGSDASEDGTERGVPIVGGNLGGFRTEPGEHLVMHENIGGNVAAADHARALRSGASHSYQFVTHTFKAEASDASEDGTGRGVPIIMAPAFSKRPGQQIATRDDGLSYALTGGEPPRLATSMVRRLVPEECERLQGFPTGWTDVEGNSDSARYKQLGNAVAVPVAEWIGHRLFSAHLQETP